MRRYATLPAAVAAIALVAPGSVLAGEGPASDRAGEVAARLSDPLTQYAIAGMISAMSKTLLDMPLEPMVDAMEKATGRRPANLPRHARVADLAGTDHEQVREKIVEHVPRAMTAMGALATAAGKMAPELERMARAIRETAGFAVVN